MSVVEFVYVSLLLANEWRMGFTMSGIRFVRKMDFIDVIFRNIFLSANI